MKEREIERLNRLKEYEKKLYDKGYKLICGIDEVGRGPLLGPVVTSAVILPVGYYNPEIKDSKKLFLLFTKYVEALVAYHKYYGGRDA